MPAPRTCGLCGCTEQIATLITGDLQTNFLPSLPVCIKCAVQEMQAPVPAAVPAHRLGD